MPDDALARAHWTLVRSRLPWALVVAVAFGVCTDVVTAQPTRSAAGLTLEEALEVAEARSESVAIARMALRRNDGEQARARSGRYPQLSGSATYERSITNEFAGLFDDDAAGPPCPSFTPNASAPLDARVAEIERALGCGAVGSGLFGGGDAQNLPFGRANTWRTTLAFSQNLYSGGRLGLQTAFVGIAREGAELGVAAARAQLRFAVTQAYYDAALSDRLVLIAEGAIAQATATLRQTQAGFDAGTQPEFEVLRARVTRDSQTPQLIRQRINRELAFQRLKQLLDLPFNAPLEVADVLSDDTLAPPAVFLQQASAVEQQLAAAGPLSSELRAEVAVPDRTAVAEADVAVRQRETSLRLTEAERQPTLAFTSTYSRIAFPQGVFPNFNRANWAVGATMNVPILTGGRQRGDEVIARADVAQARLQRQQVAELAALDTRAAWAELVAARAVWEASAGTVQQAARAYQIAEVRYQAGVSTQLELSDARLLQEQAEANRAQAARDVQVARVRIALLRDLPLGSVPSTSAGAVPRAPAPLSPQPSPAPAVLTTPFGGQTRTAAAQVGLPTGAR